MSESPSADLNIRRYLIVFGCMIASALLTVAVSLAPLGNHKWNIALALVVIAVQAFLVVGYMMHLLSERPAIYSVLGFTSFFLIFLIFLVIWSVDEAANRTRQSAPLPIPTKPAL